MVCYSHKMKCHTTPRRMDDFQLHRTIRINLTYNVEQKRSEGIHTPIFHSYEVQKQTKLIYAVRTQGSSYSHRGRGWKEEKEASVVLVKTWVYICLFWDFTSELIRLSYSATKNHQALCSPDPFWMLIILQ